jgi:hypothetical protein
MAVGVTKSKINGAIQAFSALSYRCTIRKKEGLPH